MPKMKDILNGGLSSYYYYYNGIIKNK